MRRFSTCFLASAVVSLASSSLGAQSIPVTNWTVPPYRGSGTSGGLTPMADISPGIAFVAMAPCRVIDTRGPAGPYGGPALAAYVARTFDIDNGPCTGIPAGVEAYSLSIGGIVPPTDGFLTAWPAGTAQPLISQLNMIGGEVVANAAIVPAGTNGAIHVLVSTGPTHIYIDINGYFTPQYNPGVSFRAISGNAAPAILAENTSTAAGAVAIQGVITSTTPGDFATAVLGINSGDGYGVHGSSATGFGVVAGGGAGGVWASTSGAGANGVFGQHTGSGAGVFGTAGGAVTSPYGFAGVKGESAVSVGVLGVTQSGNAVRAFASSPLGYGVWSDGDVQVEGDLSVSGMKAFVQPHPTDPSKEIRFLALEGPRSEVYFRGSAQISRGVTRIDVPEYFRLVAAPETYSALVTPVGAMATVAVLAKGEDCIVVQASRDVRVDYVVYADRAAVRQESPIVENRSFRSREDMSFLQHLPASYRELMIQNGTLNADGTVNMETARRLGWDKEWEKRPKPAPKPTPE